MSTFSSPAIVDIIGILLSALGLMLAFSLKPRHFDSASFRTMKESSMDNGLQIAVTVRGRAVAKRKGRQSK
jgi:hypothetical protein